MIQVQKLSKSYGNNHAVKNVSFSIKKGEILGFLGPNGAGKSTIMNILTGYISSTSGNVFINGVNMLDDPIKAKSNIGYLPENPPLYVEMTVNDYLCFMYNLKKCNLPKIKHIEEICNLCQITNIRGRLIRNLSKGYKQRIGLAQALINNPSVLILDEPTVGLDPSQIIEIRTLIKNFKKNHTVILSSHILPEIQAVCDRIIIINKGIVAANGTAEEIASKLTHEQHKIILRIEGSTCTIADKKDIIETLKKLDGVKYVSANIEHEKGIYDYDIETDVNVDVRRAINKLCHERKWNILMLKFSDLTLEDIFLKITNGYEIQKEEKSDAQFNIDAIEENQLTNIDKENI